MSDRKLRIAVLGTRGIPDVMGGVETHCQSLYPRLVEKGHQVTIFARKGYVASRSPYNYMGIKIVPLWAPKQKSLEAISHTLLGVLHVALRRNEIDLLHIHGIGPALLVPFARLLGLKVVMTHHGPDYDRQKWGKAAKFILRLGERLGCCYSSAFITVSKHIRSTIKELYGRGGFYIPNGVTIPEILPPGEAIECWGLTPKKYFLAVGRLVPEKGFHNLLSAFKLLDTDWRLVIAGASDHEDTYSVNLKKKATSDGRVVMTGCIKGKVLCEIFSNAGMFVLPSYHEGLPIALLEALSYQLPILASDIPANKELAGADQLYPVGEVNILYERLKSFIESPVVSAMGFDKIATEFNWDLVAKETERVYRGVYENVA